VGEPQHLNATLQLGFLLQIFNPMFPLFKLTAPSWFTEKIWSLPPQPYESCPRVNSVGTCTRGGGKKLASLVLFGP
jgi:hypothetical protein